MLRNPVGADSIQKIIGVIEIEKMQRLFDRGCPDYRGDVFNLLVNSAAQCLSVSEFIEISQIQMPPSSVSRVAIIAIAVQNKKTARGYAPN